MDIPEGLDEFDMYHQSYDSNGEIMDAYSGTCGMSYDTCYFPNCPKHDNDNDGIPNGEDSCPYDSENDIDNDNICGFNIVLI